MILRLFSRQLKESQFCFGREVPCFYNYRFILKMNTKDYPNNPGGGNGATSHVLQRFSSGNQAGLSGPRGSGQHLMNSQSFQRMISDLQIQTPLSGGGGGVSQPTPTSMVGIGAGSLLQRQQSNAQIKPNLIKRQSISSNSPSSHQLNTQKQPRKNPYLGYMNAVVAHQAPPLMSPLQNNPDQSHSFEASGFLRSSGGASNNSRIKHIKKKSKQVLAMTQRDPVINIDSPYQALQDSLQPKPFYLDTDQLHTIEESKLKVDSFEKRQHGGGGVGVAFQRKLTKVSANLQSNSQSMLNASPSILNKPVKTQRVQNKQITHVKSYQHLASHRSSQQIVGAQSMGGMQTNINSFSKSKHSIATGQKAQNQQQIFDLDEHIRGVIKSVERRKRKSQTRFEATTTEPQLYTQMSTEQTLEGRRFTLQNEQNSPISVVNPQIIQRSRLTLSQSPQSHQKSYPLRIKSSNLRHPIEEGKEPQLLYVREASGSQNMRSQSLGKRSNQSGVMNQAAGTIIVGQKGQLSKVQSTQQFKRRSGSSARRESSGNVKPKANMSALNLHNESGSVEAPRSQNGNNYSVTQRSIQIYQNANKTISMERSGSIQRNIAAKRQPYQQNILNYINQAVPTSVEEVQPVMVPPGINDRSRIARNVGFIDRTIKTTSSQFISPSSHVSKTILSGLSNQAQPIQFFNYQQNQSQVRAAGPFAQYQVPGLNQRSQSYSVIYEKFQDISLIKHFAIRSAFKRWKAQAKRNSFEIKRLGLMDKWSFGGFQNGKLGDRLCMLHMMVSKAIQMLQEIQFITEKPGKSKSLSQKMIATIQACIQDLNSLDQTPSVLYFKSSLTSKLQFLATHLSTTHSRLPPQRQPILTISLDLQLSPNLSSLSQSFSQGFAQLEHVLGQLTKGTTKPNKIDHMQTFKVDVYNIERFLDGLKGNEELCQIISDHRNPDDYTQTKDQDASAWLSLSRQLTLVSSLLPSQPIHFTYLSLDPVPLRVALLSTLENRLSTLQVKVMHLLETDTHSLKSELSRALSILERGGIDSDGISSYIEQVTTLKVLSAPHMLSQLEARHQQITQMRDMLGTRASRQLGDDVQEIDRMMKRVPNVIRDSQNRLERGKKAIEDQLKASCSQMASKVEAFYKKYNERYLQSPPNGIDNMTISQIEQIQQELEVRGRMIEDIGTKLQNYHDCIKIIGLSEDQFPHLKDHLKLKYMHQNTIKIYTKLSQYVVLTDHLRTQPFMLLDIEKVMKTLSGIDNEAWGNDPIEKVAKEAISATKWRMEVVKGMKTKSLVEGEVMRWKHYCMCFHLKQLHGMTEKFTFEDLIKNKITFNCPEVQEVFVLALQEDSQQKALKTIHQKLQAHTLKLTPLPNSEHILIFSDAHNITKDLLEDFNVQLKRIKQSNTDRDILEKAKNLQEEIENYEQLLEMLDDAGKMLVYIDTMFSSRFILSSLNDKHQEYQVLLEYYQEKMKFSIQYRLNELQKPTIKVALENICQELHELQKSLEGFFEQKRIQFPRFFFMTNLQYLEMLELAQNFKDFNHLITLVFPGAAKLYLDQPFINQQSDQIPPLLSRSQDSEIEAPYHLINSLNQVPKFKQTGPQTLPQEVLGMISRHKEMFLFDRPVMYDGKDLQTTLSGIEITMQQTVSSHISHAVTSFPRQSLDEWILDHPLQTILTTVHLILTHEINELFEDLHKKHGADGDGHDRSEYGMGHAEYLDRDAPNHFLGLTKTPDTRDLVMATASSHGLPAALHIRHPSGLTGGGGPLHQRTISLQQLNEDFLNGGVASSNGVGGAHQRNKSCQQVFHHRRGRSMVGGQKNTPAVVNRERERSPTQARFQLDEQNEEQDSEWINFRRDMFGYDFDMKNSQSDTNAQLRKKHIGSGENREETMRILQEKSFRGLYLRLQFWINQICKSLYPVLETDSNNPPNHLRHPPPQHLIMQTIVQFLTYMRDVVFELKTKQISHIEDFEWQKQLRLTWQGNSQDSTRGCRVDCGAWSTYQANEYLGNSIQRLPLSPLTNKYFVFISAALREKSAVLFRCMPTHDYAGDVFEEFSNLCSVPFKTFLCSSVHVTMKSLMQFLNGAALASSWIFFEHVDKLDYVHLQTFNKEIQMVQQQFIIAELSQEGDEEESEGEDGLHAGKELPQLPDDSNVNQSSLQIMGKAGRSQGDSQSVVKEMMRMIHDEDREMMSGSSSNVNNNEFMIKGGRNQQNSFSRRMKQRHQPKIHLEGSMISNQSQSHQYYEELGQEKDHFTQTPKQERRSHPPTTNNGYPGNGNNKVCFGVFASLSHRFNLRQELWAQEIATSLQSAFRVLALTRPELPYITSVFLKSEGFIADQDLSKKVHSTLFRIHEDLLTSGLITEADDTFSITVRELRQLSKVAGAASKLNQQAEDQELDQILLNEAKVVAEVTRLFILEKLYSYDLGNHDEMQKEVTKIVKQEFKIDSLPVLLEKSQIKSKQYFEGLQLTHDQQKALEIILEMNQKPIILVGPARSGKHTLINMLSKSVFKKKPFFFNPEAMGTFRELYGCEDPVSQVQLLQSKQLGLVSYPILQTLFEQSESTYIVLDSCLTSPFIESILTSLDSDRLTLPNGLSIRKLENPLLLVSRDLANATPRMVTTFSIAHLSSGPTDAHIRHYLQSEFSKIFTAPEVNISDIIKRLRSQEISADQARMIAKLVRMVEQARRVQWTAKKAQSLIEWAQQWVCKGKGPSLDTERIEIMVNEEKVMIEDQILVNGEMRIAKKFLQGVISLGFEFISVLGSMKNTFVRYFAKDVVDCQFLPKTSLLKQSKIRDILKGVKKAKSVFIVDDLNMRASIYLKYLKLNQGRSLDPEHPSFIDIPQFATIVLQRSTSDPAAFPITISSPLSNTDFSQALISLYQPAAAPSLSQHLQSLLSKPSLSLTAALTLLRTAPYLTNLTLTAPAPCLGKNQLAKLPYHLILVTPHAQKGLEGVRKFRDTRKMIEEMVRDQTGQVVIEASGDRTQLEVALLFSQAQDDPMYKRAFEQLTGSQIPQNSKVRIVVSVKNEEEAEEVVQMVPELYKQFVKFKVLDELPEGENEIFYKVHNWLQELIPTHRFTSDNFNSFSTLYKDLYSKLSDSLTSQLTHHSQLAAQYTHLMQLVSNQDTNTQVTRNHLQQIQYLNLVDKTSKLQSRLALYKKKLSELDTQIEELRKIVDKDDEKDQEEEIRVMLEALQRVPREEWRREIVMSKDLQVMRLVQAVERVIEFKLNILLPSEVAQKLLAKQSISTELKLQIQKLQTMNPKSLPGLLLAILIKLSNRSLQKQSPKDLSLLKADLSRFEVLQQIYLKKCEAFQEELEDLIMKERTIRAEGKSCQITQQVKLIKAEQSRKGLVRMGKRSIEKVEKIQLRQKYLEGDCLMLALSVAYLGSLEVEKRMHIRKEVSERLLLEDNKETSNCWSNSETEQAHCQQFLKVLKTDFEMGYQIFTKLNHLHVDSVFAEFLFYITNSNKVPILFDPSGVYLDALTSHVFSSYTVISGSVQQADKQLQEQNDSKISIVTDLSDGFGRTSDTYTLNTLHIQNSTPSFSILKGSKQIRFPQTLIHQCTQPDGVDFLNCEFLNKNEAWIELKLILLKHFLPEHSHRIQVVITQMQDLKGKMKTLQSQIFGSGGMYMDSHVLESEDAIEAYEELRMAEEEFNEYSQMFHQMINEHPLLASYSNIFVILYLSLKELSKRTQEVTYTWRIYTKMLDMIIAKIIRDLTLNMKNREESEHDSDSRHLSKDHSMTSTDKKKRHQKEFTIDEDFFHSVIMPGIYNALISGLRQEYVPLFNLIFSLEIARKKASISDDEKEWFENRFFQIENCWEWRLNHAKSISQSKGFVTDRSSRLFYSQYLEIKKSLLKLYPDLKKLFETLELRVNPKDSSYKQLSDFLYKKLFKKDCDDDFLRQWKDLPLMKKLNLGFLCPDDEWRSRLCQFVYEELSTIFDFSEELAKLHSFIKTASWNLPIALFTQNSINIVNTVCSIASYYGVGLEVLRTDVCQNNQRQADYFWNLEVDHKSNDIRDPKLPLTNEAAVLNHAHYLEKRSLQSAKSQFDKMFCKDDMIIEEKQQNQQAQQIDLIKRCAENGTWVLISTLIFPTYWHKLCLKLRRMADKGKILNTFRIFFDLQGYSIQEIPTSFLADNCVRFYLTDRNNEDMEGFNDVWANILNDDLLNKRDILTPIPHTLTSASPDPQPYASRPKPISAGKPAPLILAPPSLDHSSQLDLSMQQHSITLILNPSEQHRDIRSPPRGRVSRLFVGSSRRHGRGGLFRRDVMDDADIMVSEISRVTSVMSFATPSMVATEDRKIQKPHKEEEVKRALNERYELVASAKQPSKRIQPAQKH